MKPLFTALGRFRAEVGDDFVADITSVERFEALLSTYLTHVASDPSFIAKEVEINTPAREGTCLA
jgi:hypothetical protein